MFVYDTCESSGALAAPSRPVVLVVPGRVAVTSPQICLAVAVQVLQVRRITATPPLAECAVMIEELYDEIDDLEDELEFVGQDTMLDERGMVPSMEDLQSQQQGPQ